MTQATEADIRTEENAVANNADAQEQDMADATETQTPDNDSEITPEEAEAALEGATFDYEDKSEDELQDMARNWNDEMDLHHTDPAYIKVSQTKGDLIESFEQRDDRLKFLKQRGAGIRSHTGGTLTLNRLKQHPANPRHKADYIDPEFQDMLAAEGGISDSLTVVESSETNEDGETIHYVLSGNRRLANLKALIDSGEWDIDPADYEVNVVFREVEDEDADETAREMDEMRLLVNANESQWDLSVVDKFKAMQYMKDRGATQADIADEFEVSAPFVSNVLKLRFLPDSVLDLVHFGANAERFAEQGEDVLKSKGVPYHVEDGEVVVHSIPWKNALYLAKQVNDYAKRNDLSEKDAAKEWKSFIENADARFDYNGEEFSGVLAAARIMGQSGFKKWLRTEARDAGLYPEQDTSGSTSSKSTSSIEVEDPSADGAQDTTETKGEDLPEGDGTVEVEGEAIDFADVVNEIRVGNITMADDWEDTLCDELTMGERKAEIAVEFLINAGILVSA